MGSLSSQLFKKPRTYSCSSLSSLGFLLSERTSGVSPVIFGFVQLAIFCKRNNEMGHL